MLSENEFPEPGGIPYAMLTLEGTQKILSGEKVSYEKMLEMQKGIILAESFALKKYTSFSLMGLENIDTLRNVIGLIQGNDQELQKEYIVLSAHYDHVGLYNGLICNGANDNASGVVAVLELAKRFASEKSNKRSIILAFFTAEEKGLLGSEAFVRDFSDNHKIVANINIDMCGRGDTNQIFAIGADRTSSDLAEIIQICNAQTVHMGIDLSLSNSAYFNLSDHYPFAKKEIPAVFFFDNYKNGLHGPDDEFEHINFEKIMKVVLLTEQITHHLNNMQTCPVFDG